MADALQNPPYRHREVVIMDPSTKKQLSVEQALSASVIDKNTAENLARHQGGWIETNHK